MARRRRDELKDLEKEQPKEESGEAPRSRFRLPWLTVTSAVALIVKAVLWHFEIRLEAPAVNEMIIAICGMLAVIGIVQKPEEEE